MRRLGMQPLAPQLIFLPRFKSMWHLEPAGWIKLLKMREGQIENQLYKNISISLNYKSFYTFSNYYFIDSLEIYALICCPAA